MKDAKARNDIEDLKYILSNYKDSILRLDELLCLLIEHLELRVEFVSATKRLVPKEKS